MLAHLRRRRGCPPPKARVLAQGTTLYSRTPQECSSWTQYSTFTSPQQGGFRCRKDSRKGIPRGKSLRMCLKKLSFYLNKKAHQHEGNEKEITSPTFPPCSVFSTTSVTRVMEKAPWIDTSSATEAKPTSERPPPECARL